MRQPLDTLAAQTVLELIEEYKHIRLILVLPCKTQTKYWQKADITDGDYTITENISDSIANMVIANSTFTVNHADGETDTIAAGSVTAQSRTVRINDNGQTNIEFINTFVTDKLNIVKESEDGLRARKVRAM